MPQGTDPLDIYHNGQWYSRNGSATTQYVLSQSAVSSSVTGTTTETTLATVTIPGGSMGPNGALRIDVSASWTANTNLKTLNIKLGGTLIGGFGRSGATETGARTQVVVENRGSQTSQVISQPSATSIIFGVFTVAYPATLTKDTSQDLALTITGTLANSADTITLERYLVEVIPA